MHMHIHAPYKPHPSTSLPLAAGEEVVTRESLISICWRLVPYWLSKWERKWGGETNSMMFELPHFALELMVILPCIQVRACRVALGCGCVCGGGESTGVAVPPCVQVCVGEVGLGWGCAGGWGSTALVVLPCIHVCVCGEGRGGAVDAQLCSPAFVGAWSHSRAVGTTVALSHALLYSAFVRGGVGVERCVCDEARAAGCMGHHVHAWLRLKAAPWGHATATSPPSCYPPHALRHLRPQPCPSCTVCQPCPSCHTCLL